MKKSWRATSSILSQNSANNAEEASSVSRCASLWPSLKISKLKCLCFQNLLHFHSFEHPQEIRHLKSH
jgi:hypothetical protein